MQGCEECFTGVWTFEVSDAPDSSASTWTIQLSASGISFSVVRNCMKNIQLAHMPMMWDKTTPKNDGLRNMHSPAYNLLHTRTQYNSNQLKILGQ